MGQITDLHETKYGFNMRITHVIHTQVQVSSTISESLSDSAVMTDSMATNNGELASVSNSMSISQKDHVTSV